jgi:aspartate/methionine/tyrosine aminotransferase
VVEAAERAAREPVLPPSRGLPEFCEAVATTLANEFSASIDPAEQVLATSGGMHALYVVFATLLEPGDEVLAPAPCYYLEGLVHPFGGSLVYVPMPEEENYRWDFDRLESKVTRKTKLLFVNTPMNPGGYVLTAADLGEVARLAQRYDLLVVADESYDRLVYDGLAHLSVASVPSLRDRVILVRSFTKSYAMPGWRVGYIVAPPGLAGSLTKAFEWIMLYGSYVSQKAATAALLGPQDWLANVARDFQANRDFVWGGLQGLPGLRCAKPQGTPFLFPNVSGLRGTTEEVSALLLKDYGIPTVPGCYFQTEGHVRLALGGTRAVLEELLSRLRLAVERMAFGVQKGFSRSVGEADQL